MKKSNYEGELERLQQRSYAAMITERELTNTLRLAQQAQSPVRQPGKPQSPTQQPTQPKTPPKTPAPSKPPTQRPTEMYQSNTPKQEYAFFNWQDKTTYCGQCLTVLMGSPFLDIVVLRGICNGNIYGKAISWISRIDNPRTRCDVCGRKISG